MNSMPVKHNPFFHVALEGTYYEVGRMQGEMVRSIPGWLGFVRSGKGAFSREEFQTVCQQFERYCPGINDEIRGLADGAGLQVDEVMYYALTYLRKGNCSQMAFLPQTTADGHTLAARSYEFGDNEDDYRLCTTRIQGKHAHLGFSSLILGRDDGMNDQGLSVTMSSGGIPLGKKDKLPQSGFQFWALIRHLLDSCGTVDEALGVIEDFPVCGNNILVLAEKTGKAGLVEYYGPKRSVRCYDSNTEQGFAVATNHYTLPEMLGQPARRLANSPVRYRRINSFAMAEAPQITIEKVKTLLGTAYPEGLCCHYYKEYFGTMHSLVFDLTTGKAEICFGSPRANPWYSMDLTTPARQEPYITALPQEKAEPSFWR